MSVSNMLSSDSLDNTTQTIELAMKSHDFLEDIDHDCDQPNHTSNCDANGHLNGNCDVHFDIKPGKHTAFSTGHLDLPENNTIWESEEGNRNCSLDFQTKRFGACLPKTECRNIGKRKIEHQPLKGRRLLPLPPELEFVEEEDLSENEESSEEDSTDNAFHFSSKDGLDHKKERHQYVSDKLDPDVLHLLEMHLRKQQLVDIKEEGEEELLDVHVNKERTRSESYKLLRNISPVLDMVLEEPELEHAGDMLEEGSKTPSDIDSDDSSNVSAIEAGLMESLQLDLMSKIDKHELFTILQGSDTDIMPQNKTKQKEGSLQLSEYKTANGNIQRKEPKTPIQQMRVSGDLEVIHEDGLEDPGSDLVSKDVASSLVSEGSGSDIVPEGSTPDLVSEDFGSDPISEDVGSDLVSEDVGCDPVSEDGGSDLVSEDVGSDLISEDIKSDLVAGDVRSDLVSEDVASDLVSEDVASDLISEDVESDLVSEEVLSDLISDDVGSELVSEDVGSDLVSEEAGPDLVLEDASNVAQMTNQQLQSEFSALGVLPQPLGTLLGAESTEMFVNNNILPESLQDLQSSKVKSFDQDFVPDVAQQPILEAVSQTTNLESLPVTEDRLFHDSETTFPDSVNVNHPSSPPCPTLNGNVRSLQASLESTESHEIKETDNSYPNDGDSSEQQDVVDTAITDHLNNLNKDIKETVKSQSEPDSSETPLCSTADMNTLQTDLQKKILSLLEKAHAADCRSSHLQAEAELLFKESIELRNECKSLSKEAADLLSIFTQQGLLQRHQMGESIQKSEAEGSANTSETKPRNKKTLSYARKRNPRSKKGESPLQVLSQKYDFLREEGPEIMRELHELQQDLKNLPPRHSKPISVFYKWLWGSLIAGSTMFLVLWSAKHLV